MSPDESLLCIGGGGGKVRVYKNISGSFLLTQTIILSFAIFDLKLSNEKMVVVGLSSLVRFYQYNGSAFELEQTYLASDFSIVQIEIFHDFSTMIFGGSSNEMKVIRKSSNTYELVESYPVGSFIFKVSSDRLFLYFVVSSGLGLHIFY